MRARTLRLLIPYILISASVYPVAKDGLAYGSPFLLMGMRYLTSSAIFMAMTRKLLLKRGVILLGVALSSSSVLWIVGLQYVSSGESAVLSYTMPFFAIFLSVLMLNERATARQFFGVIVGFTGTALFTGSLSLGFALLGSALTIGGAIAWAIYTVYLRKLKEEDRASVLGTACLVGCVPFIVGSIAYHNADWGIRFVGDGLYLALSGGVVAIYLLSTMLREERVGPITSTFFVVPAVSLAIQVIQTSVLPSVPELVGCAVILFGVYIAGSQ